jgi:hypothetical protein
MIGYSMGARTRYHKERGFTGWAQCRLITLAFRAQDELLGEEVAEDILRRENPCLSRCPRCWPAPTGPAKGEG